MPGRPQTRPGIFLTFAEGKLVSQRMGAAHCSRSFHTPEIQAQSVEPQCGGDGLRSFTTNKNHAPAEEAELRLVEEPVAIAAAPETCPPQAVPELL
jgi:hypothetical protein